jgi:hypothetical protein
MFIRLFREEFPSTVSAPVRSGHFDKAKNRFMQARLTLGIDPVSIEIGQCSLVTNMFHRFGGFLINDAAGPPAAALLLGVGR